MTLKEASSMVFLDFFGKTVGIMTQCLKITQNVAFEFLNFGIFHQILSY